MNKQILKWTAKPAEAGLFDLELPNGTEIVAVQNQNEKIAIWGLVSPEEIENTVRRTFELRHTGDAFDFVAGQKRYLSTLQFEEGNYVIHIFEIILYHYDSPHRDT